MAYTIEDGDGDKASAKLTITVTDAGVGIGGNEGAPDKPGGPNVPYDPSGLDDDETPSAPAAWKADAVVHERGLPDGTAKGDGSDVVTSTFTITAPDGIAEFKINGQDVTTGKTITGEHGTLSVTGISDPDPDGVYTVTYTYTLTTAPDNTAAGATGDFSSDNFTVTVKDSDGDTRTVPLVIAIEDDEPVAKDDFRTLTLEDQDGDKVTSNPVITGNVISGVYVGSDYSGKDTPGADGFKDGSVQWAAGEVTTGHPENASPDEQDFNTAFSLDSATAPGEYTVMDANGGRAVGTIRLGKDGNYTFTANAAYEPEHGGHTIVIPYSFEDKDGDTAEAALRITINNVNDKPVFDVVKVDGIDLAGTGAVKEDGVYAEGSPPPRWSRTSTSPRRREALVPASTSL